MSSVEVQNVFQFISRHSHHCFPDNLWWNKKMERRKDVHVREDAAAWNPPRDCAWRAPHPRGVSAASSPWTWAWLRKARAPLPALTRRLHELLVPYHTGVTVVWRLAFMFCSFILFLFLTSSPPNPELIYPRVDSPFHSVGILWI